MAETHTNDNGETWKREVTRVAQKAAETLPALNGRIQKAMDLIFTGAITRMADNTAMVRSQTNPEHQYTVTPESCACMDFVDAPEGLCKHRLAWMIYRRALCNLLKEGSAPAAAPSATPTAPEGAVEATVCITATRADGRKVTWTFRGTDQAAAAWFETRNAYLDSRFPGKAGRAAAPSQAPRREAEPEAEPEREGEEEAWCTIHEEWMSWKPANEYGPGWHSHQLEDGSYCKGKPKRQQRPGRRGGRR